jgi:hypothetical protein
MPSAQQFETLRLELRRGGVTPVFIERTLLELREHLADLEAAALETGLCPEEAARSALERLGSPQTIAAAVLAQPALLGFSHRWPRASAYLRCAVLIAALPGLPVVYCIDRSAQIARWGIASGLAMLLVGSLLSWLNWMTLIE